MQSQRAIHRLLPSAAIAALASWSISPARAETPTQTCSRVSTDDTLRPISISLVPAVNTLFHTSVPPQMALDSTVFRCADGHVLACTTGANLPCGKANLSLTSTGAAEWCRDNPSAAFVPAVATGHYTIYQWRCRNGSPEIVRQISTVDSRGFVARYWKRLRHVSIENHPARLTHWSGDTFLLAFPNPDISPGLIIFRFDTDAPQARGFDGSRVPATLTVNYGRFDRAP